MIFQLLQKAIEQKNEYMTPDMIKLQIEFFNTAGKITDDEKTQLLEFLEPAQPEVQTDPLAAPGANSSTEQTITDQTS